MTPRPYQQTQRQASADQTGARILKAARELLFSPRADAVFSLDAVARRAKVTRRTVYLRYGSRRGLIEAAFDAMAAKNGMGGIGHAFQQEDPMEALMAAVAFFCRFWAQGRAGMRRVRAHAEFDPELAEAIAERQERRRAVFTALSKHLRLKEDDQATDLVDLIFAATSFEVFDLLAGARLDQEAVCAKVQGLVQAIVTRQP